MTKWPKRQTINKDNKRQSGKKSSFITNGQSGKRLKIYINIKKKIVGKLQTIEEIISKFTVKHLPKIDGEPTYESINQWMQLLYANTATLPTTLGGGRHGHIGMIMLPASYATLPTVAYNTPTDLGPLPIFRRTDTDQARQETSNEFYENKQVFENHYNMAQALTLQKNQSD